MNNAQIISAALLLFEFSGYFSAIKIARIIRDNRNKEQKETDTKTKQDLNYYTSIINQLSKEI
jgi:hypothetical protein